MELTVARGQTAVEATPEEWVVKSLSDIADIRSGGTPSTSNSRYWSGEIPWCTPTDITALNGRKYLRSTARAITPEGLAASAAELVPAWSVLMTSRATIGQCAINTAPVTTNQGFKNFVPFAGTDSEFLYYLLSTQTLGFIRLCGGSTFLEVGKRQLATYKVSLPATKAEQRAVATALSDVDALLGGLDRLIAKKRDLKLAAMQQLLTGETRLPGFSGKWEVKRLGEALTICHGKSQREVEVADGQYPILATGGQIGTASRPLYDKPSVLIGRKGTIDRPQFMRTPFWTVDTLFYSIMKDGNDARFFYYRFCLIQWMQFNEASGVPSMNARTIEQIEIACPEPAEQATIATILSDMDTELAALEQRRAKTRALKQAMMQELLTGRTRLV